MRGFAIRAYRRRYIAHPRTPPEGVKAALMNGWKPYRFVPTLADAEKFGSREAAELFRRGLDKLNVFEVVEIGGDGERAIA